MDLLSKEFAWFFTCAQKNSLRYLLIGGYAVNYYGYSRHTADMDIWLAPTNANKISFINTLLCMNYIESETEPLLQEDFTTYFKGTIGSESDKMDVLTMVHHNLSFDEAEKHKSIFEIETGVSINIVPYNFLKEMKLLSRRDKDLWDIARLEELRNLK